MGKVLQIRVSASTYDPEDVYRVWPRLSKLAWGDKRFAENASIGVRELAAKLADRSKFDNDWADDVKRIVEEAVPNLDELDNRLETALADRNPSKADGISYELEDALSELENEVK